MSTTPTIFTVVTTKLNAAQNAGNLGPARAQGQHKRLGHFMGSGTELLSNPRVTQQPANDAHWRNAA